MGLHVEIEIWIKPLIHCLSGLKISHYRRINLNVSPGAVTITLTKQSPAKSCAYLTGNTIGWKHPLLCSARYPISHYPEACHSRHWRDSIRLRYFTSHLITVPGRSLVSYHSPQRDSAIGRTPAISIFEYIFHWGYQIKPTCFVIIRRHHKIWWYTGH